MKIYWLLCTFLLLLAGVAAAQQAGVTNAIATNTDEILPSERAAFLEIKTKAKQGDVEAQLVLVKRYFDGIGVATNIVEALKWLQKAGEQGNATAQFMLGLAYDGAYGVTPNYSEAFKWLRKAAEQGNADAQYVLARDLWAGEGGMTNQNEAVHWFQKAAEQGNVEAEYHLARALFYGKGVVQNYEEAMKWYRKAAAQNNTFAQTALGVLYFQGEGLTQDFVKAYAWFSIAAANGNADAIKMRDSVLNVLTSEQVAEGQRFARQFATRTEKPNSNSHVATDLPKATGTGFFITDDGYLISNYHVVKDAAKVRLLTGAGLIDATVVKVDAANDLALLKTRNDEGRMMNDETGQKTSSGNPNFIIHNSSFIIHHS